MTLDSSAKEVVETSTGPVDNSAVSKPDNAAPLSSAKPSDVNTAASSTVEKPSDKKPESMLDAVQTALKKPTGEAPLPSENSQADPQSPDGLPDMEDYSVDPTDEELQRYHSRTRKRVKGLIDRAKTAERKLAEYEPAVRQMQGLTSFIQEADLSVEEVNKGFDIMRIMKTGSPEEALQAILPYVQQLQAAAGYVLPTDIHRKVEEGILDRETALELSRTRARAEHAAQETERTRLQAEQRARQQQISSFANAARDAVTQWENRWAQSDPDYKAKQPRVMKEIELALLKNGMPRSVEEAVRMADEAKKAVEAEYRSLVGNRPEVRPVMGGSNLAAVNTANVLKKEPTTFAEAISLGLARAKAS